MWQFDEEQGKLIDDKTGATMADVEFFDLDNDVDEDYIDPDDPPENYWHDYCIYDNWNWKKVVFCHGVTEITDPCLGAVNLREVVLPNGITKIGENAFSGCINLNKINIPNSVVVIDAFSFTGCAAEISKLPNKLEIIGESAFAEDSNVCGCSFGDLIIPNTVQEIGDRAFSNCSFETLTIQNGVKKIGEEAFAECYFSEDVDEQELIIPESVIEIGDGAFSCVYGLAKVAISRRFEDELERIGLDDMEIVWLEDEE